MALPSAYAVALLTVLNVKRYSEELSKKVTRFRMSRLALAKLGARKRLRSAFLEEFEEHMDWLGWTMIEMADGGFAFIEASSMEGWTKISSKRIAKDMKDIEKGRKTEDDLEAELELSDDSDDNSEEE